MSKLNYVLIIIITALTLSTVYSTICWNRTSKHLKTVEQTVEFQQTTIDSLLKRRMTVFDVTLAVTDRSKFSIYGKYNKGTINVPNTRTYELKIDSTKIDLK